MFNFKNSVLAGRYIIIDNGCITGDEYVLIWSRLYHDDLPTSTAFFNNMDMNKDGCLEDIEVIIESLRETHQIGLF